MTEVSQNLPPDTRRRRVLARLAAVAWDIPVMAGWAAFAAIVEVGLRWYAGIGPRPPWALDLQAFLTLILPVTITLAYQEGSAGQATFGKRRARLIVTDVAGRPPGYRRALVRSTVKLLPWQLGHTAVFNLATGSTSAAFVGLSIGAQSLVLLSFLMVVMDGRQRALHDRVAGTLVQLAQGRPVSPRGS